LFAMDCFNVAAISSALMYTPGVVVEEGADGA
jgi:hypothetical protein